MDNLTHSLIGTWIAEGITTKSELVDSSNEKRGRFAIFLAAILGANLPDADLLFTLGIKWFSRLHDQSTLSPDFFKLHYLLHHRGHTHTIVGIILLWPLAVLTAIFFSRIDFRKLKTHLPLRNSIFLSALLGLISHLLADALNDYGIHPFWPFFNEWFYTGVLFIVEPVPLCIFSSFLLFSKQTNKSMTALAKTIGAAIPLFLFMASSQPWYSWTGKIVSIFAFIGGSVLFFVLRKKSVNKQVRFRYLSLSLVTFLALQGCLFLFVRFSPALKLGQSTVNFTSLTPLPANPLCWRIISSAVTSEVTQSDESASLLLQTRWGIFSFLPVCAPLFEETSKPTRAPWEPWISQSAEPGPSRIVWVKRRFEDLNELRKLANSNCAVSAFLQFSRFPYLVHSSPAPMATLTKQNNTLGDLRYSRSTQNGFAEIDYETISEADCRFFRIPLFAPWEAPLSVSKKIP